jgi:TonB-linked SusC/RagA family outer membrane protein
MKNKPRLLKQLMTLFFAIAALSFLHAQNTRSSVSGTVLDEKGAPLRGVTVIAKNMKTNFSAGAQTDSLGVFTFQKLPEGGPYTFTVSSVGYEQQIMSGYDIKTDRTVSVSVKLKSLSETLSDVVVVGYGTQKKLNLTGAVAQVSGEVLENRPLTNISQGLQGVIPNLNIIMGDGKPVQSPTFNIRGTTSIGQGGSALVLIDGIQGDPALLNPNDVASVSVLKDAASASIYGARAAYGVVLITTKNPAKDKFSITYSSNYSLKSPTSVPDVITNGYEFAVIFDSAWSAWNDYSQTAQNINKTQPFSKAYLAEYKKRNADPSLPKVEVGANGSYVYYGNMDWYGALYKKHIGSVDQNLSISGSSGKTSFYVTGRYFGQDGLFRYNSDDYKMYNVTAKGASQVLPWLQITNTTQYSSRFYHNPLNVGEGGGIWRNMADEAHPSSMMYNPDGTLTFSAAYTVGDFVYGKNGIDFTDQVLKNTTGFNAKIIGNELRLKGDFTFQNTTSLQKQLRVQVPYSVTPGVINYVGTATNDITQTQRQSNYIAANIYAEYEKTLGKSHYIKILAGYNYEQATNNELKASRNGLIYADARDINLALGQSISTSGGYEKWAILGGFSRLNYSYKDRYLLEVNGRYDGSSKFPSSQRYAFFPSASAGWRISKESFWQVPPSAVTDLKIRASYGSLGNGNIASYAYQEQFGITQSGRVLGGVLPQYTSAPGVVPDGLTWETAITSDLGLDASFLSNRLTFTGDVYKRRTKDMFTVGMTLPAVFGATVPKGNYADLTTTGWELAINWKDRISIGSKDFHYSIGVSLSDYSSVIDKFNNATNSLGDYYPGKKVGEIWGYTNDGYWTAANVSQAKTMQALFKASNTGIWLPGDIKFKDLNGDGVINNGDNTLANPGDMRVIGNSTPRYSYGITLSADYNNFFFSAFLQGVGKQDWWPGSEADAFWGVYNRPYNFAMTYQTNNMWSESNPDAYFPRLRGYVAQNGQGELFNAQTKYLQNARYIRLKNIQVGYNLPAGLLSKAHISSARLYVSGENLWSASPLYKLTKNIDVENIGKSDAILTGTSNNGNGNNYPILKSITVGLSVTF